MADKLKFQEKLSGILHLAEEKQMHLNIEEIEKFFEEEALSAQQIELVCDYLLSQKVAVSGYEKKPGVIRQAEEEREELTREEQEYLESYLREIHEMVPRTPEESRLVAYMPLVTEEALKLPRQGVFLGDVIQEGNVSLVGALLAYAPGEEKKEEILKEIRASMRALLESQLEMKRQDRKMVDRVSDLEATIREMSDGLGRKVDVEEVAEKMGVSEEEIEDILKLAGEEWKEE